MCFPTPFQGVLQLQASLLIQGQHTGTLQDDLPGIFDQPLRGAVRTLEPASLAQLRECLLGKDVPTGYHHGRISICGLVFGDGTDEDTVV